MHTHIYTHTFHQLVVTGSIPRPAFLGTICVLKLALQMSLNGGCPGSGPCLFIELSVPIRLLLPRNNVMQPICAVTSCCLITFPVHVAQPANVT